MTRIAYDTHSGRSERRGAMAWIILAVSGMLEAVWATALDASKGFKKWLPTAIFAVSIVASMIGLSFAMRSIPAGTAYAVWVGIGAVLTVLIPVIRRTETLTRSRALLLLLVVGSIIGLKVVA